jgi:hypothetical protein
VARKTKYGTDEKGGELTELLDTLESMLERTKILYEQYFMGIQKIPPSQLHRDIERKIRELTQEQIRNTALRFRLTTITQKFGSYNTYWKRTIQAIEQGRYARDIAKAQRRANRMGEDVPDELLVNMPKAMRDRIRRDREKLAAHGDAEHAGHEEAMVYDFPPEDSDTEPDLDIQRILDGLDRETAPAVRPQARQQVHQIEEDDFDGRLDELFASLTGEAEPVAAPPPKPAPAPRPAPAQAATPPRAIPDIPARPAATPPRAIPDIPARTAATSRPATSSPSASPVRPAPPVETSAVPPPPGMTEAETRVLYEQYRQARQLVGGGDDMTYDRLKRKLNEQAPRLMEQYNAQGVRYDVVVKDDKVVLKATPKRE